jgi:hypothetical protein
MREQSERIEIKIFGHLFYVFEEHAKDLVTIEKEGAIYSCFWSEESQCFKDYRIQLLPAEVFLYIEAMIAKQEFDQALDNGATFAEAISAIHNPIIAKKVESYGNYGRTELKDGTFADLRGCYASFIGDEIEALICGTRPDRYEERPFKRSKSPSKPVVDYRMIYDALLDGYRTTKQLEIMMKLELNKNLYEVAEGENVGEVVFSLIIWAERTGKLNKFLQAAISHNPHNVRLKVLGSLLD